MEEDQAEVITMALTREGITGREAEVATMTKGDWAAVPVEVERRGSEEETMRPTTKTVYVGWLGVWIGVYACGCVCVVMWVGERR